MPLDEVKVLHKINCLDAHAIEKRSWVTAIDIKKGSNNATDVDTDFDDAFHPGYRTQTFDGGLQNFAMRFNKIKFALVLSKLFCFTMGFDLGRIILTDKRQNRD